MAGSGAGAVGRVAPQKAHLSSDMVKRVLDENQQLLLAVMENQDKGKRKECMLYLRKLHDNLLMLGTVGDAQVNNVALPTQLDVKSLSAPPRAEAPAEAPADAHSGAGASSSAAAGAAGAPSRTAQSGEEAGAVTSRTRGAGKRGREVVVEEEEAWTSAEKDALYRSISINGQANYEKHAKAVGSRDAAACARFLEQDRTKYSQDKEAQRARMEGEFRAVRESAQAPV